MKKLVPSASLLSGVLLLVGLAPLPIGYYIFLRIIVFLAALLCIYSEYVVKKGDFSVWMLVFGVIAIIFNPIIKIYLGSKGVWAPIDTISAIVFFVYTLARRVK